MNWREDAEAIVSESHVVAVARSPGRDYAAPVKLAKQFRLKGSNELMFLGHAPDPTIGFNCHDGTREYKDE